MDYRPEIKRHSMDDKSCVPSAKITLPLAGQGVDLWDRFEQEKSNYADLHHNSTRNAKDVSDKCSTDYQKQRYKKDEVVKYMSKLPNYLEKGKSLQEKVLNVGVLDWGRLERWQCRHKQMLQSGNRPSLSCNDLPSSFSTDASASQSSRVYISSPPHQRVRRPSLQYHLSSSPADAFPKAVKSFGKTVDKFQDLKDGHTNTVYNPSKFIRTEKFFGKTHPETELEELKGIDSDSKVSSESGASSNVVKYGVASTTKVKLKSEDGQYEKRAEKWREGNHDVPDHVGSRKRENVIVMPSDVPQNNVSSAPNFSDSTMTLDQHAAETRQRSFSERSKDAQSYEVDKHAHLQIKQTGLTDAKIDNSSKRCQSVPRSANRGNCPSRGERLEDKKLATTVDKPSTSEPLVDLDRRVSKGGTEKVRSTSPFRRLSFSISKISKPGSKDVSALPQLNTTFSCQSASENVVASSVRDTSSSNQGNATRRASSSPLRRLLDPILKSRPANCRNNSAPLPRDLIAKDRASKSSDGMPYSTNVAAQSEKVKLNMTSCRTVNINNSLQEKKHESPAAQALLRVAVKNGLPLFTFAVDNASDILAATFKKLSTSRKEDYSCLYTFFTIQEVKKKNARWLNQGAKGQTHDYIPNVVAQMKVRGSCSSNLIKDSYANHFRMREFVLCSVELRPTDLQTSDSQPNDELAAIVVKIPMRISSSHMHEDHLEEGLEDNFPEVASDSDCGTELQHCLCKIGQDIGATVILPSGVHALPPKGEPSSLIRRWRSGGSCDCGGWDLGCKLRILTNWNKLIKKVDSSKACSTSDHFELFNQEGVQDNWPFFSLAPFKDGIYSVEFNSSLSLLQAFSICIAILDCRKTCEPCEFRSHFEEKAYRETVSVPFGGIRAPDRTGEVPARYVSNPPLSPAGRV